MNYYEILGIHTDATSQQIKEGYRREALKSHPDRHEGATAKAEANRRFKDLALSYRTLQDPAKRSEYDRLLKQKRQGEYEARQQEQARQRQVRRQRPEEDFADTIFEDGSAYDEDANRTFSGQMLELAIELAKRRFSREKISNALIAFGCPDAMAINVAKSATARKRSRTKIQDAGHNASPPPSSHRKSRRASVESKSSGSWGAVEQLFTAALVGPGFERPPNVHFGMLKFVRGTIFSVTILVIWGLLAQGGILRTDDFVGMALISVLLGWGIPFGLMEFFQTHRQYVLSQRLDTYLPVFKQMFNGGRKYRTSMALFFSPPWLGYYGLIWPLVAVASLFFAIDSMLLLYVGDDMQVDSSIVSAWKFFKSPWVGTCIWIGLGATFELLVFRKIHSQIKKLVARKSWDIELTLYRSCRPRLWRAYLSSVIFFLVVLAPGTLMFPEARDRFEAVVAAEKLSPQQLFDKAKPIVNGEKGSSNLSLTTAMQFLQIAADKEFVPAQRLLIYCYLYSKVAKNDTERGKYWLEKAAAHDDAWSMDVIGSSFYDALNGFPQDDRKAVFYWLKAAQLGSASAQVRMGWSYMFGVGEIPIDFEKAAYWNDLGARGGNPEGFTNLGWLYETGKGVPHDISVAADMYRKAAELGSQEAKQRLLNMPANR